MKLKGEYMKLSYEDQKVIIMYVDALMHATEDVAAAYAVGNSEQIKRKEAYKKDGYQKFLRVIDGIE